MALPQQAIERMMQEPSVTQGVYGQLLMFTGTIFFIIIVVALGLMFGYQPYLDNKLEDIQSQIQQVSDQMPKTEQDTLANSYSQLVNVQTLLAAHGTASPLVDWLNSVTHPNIYFGNMNYTALNKQLILNGTAKMPSEIAEQIAILERDPHVIRVVVPSLTAETQDGQNSAHFTVNVVLKDDLFKVSSISAVSSPATP
ncbi:MAG: hypothetical protein Q7S28_04310 [bacterium]|nr:hypothetical protein [bacterium]